MFPFFFSFSRVLTSTFAIGREPLAERLAVGESDDQRLAGCHNRKPCQTNSDLPDGLNQLSKEGDNFKKDYAAGQLFEEKLQKASACTTRNCSLTFA